MLRALAVAGLVLGSGYAFAQAAAPRPEFEVAAIKPNKPGKPNKSGDGRMMVMPAPGGRFTATNIPLLDYTPEQGQFQASAAGTSLLPPPSIDSNGPSLFTALQERLGLKLEPGKGRWISW